jgi:hypothetical protein
MNPDWVSIQITARFNSCFHAKLGLRIEDTLEFEILKSGWTREVKHAYIVRCWSSLSHFSFQNEISPRVYMIPDQRFNPDQLKL